MKHRNKVDIEAAPKLQLTPVIPDFKLMCSSKQFHPSHREVNVE